MRRLISASLALALVSGAAAATEKTKIVLVAGNPSHGPGDHEFNAGLMLLEKCLKSMPNVEPVVVKGGWPKSADVFENAATVVFFMDGGGGHPVIREDHWTTLRQLVDAGTGLVFMHYAVEVPKGEFGDGFLEFLGGYYETGFSTNPHWVADFKSLPKHEVTKGVKPFSIKDEWYYNIRFRPEMKGITPILVAKPDEEARAGKTSSPRGPYAHIVDAKGREEVVAWTVERPDGGRSFGFTGGHTHKNWGDANFRTLVLNAILWTAKVDVPAEGAGCEVSEADLKANLDPK